MRPKLPCKFKENCNNYKIGQACPYSHDNVPAGGSAIGSRINRNPGSSKFDKPMHETQCNFGATCRKRQEGKCFFKHSDVAQQQGGRRPESRPRQPISQVPCKFGASCNKYPLGQCPYKHEAAFQEPRAPQIPVERPAVVNPPQNHLSGLSNLCLNYLTNKPCEESTCLKPHTHTQSRSITKIFTMSTSQPSLHKKILIVEPQTSQQQPIYIILAQNRIIFGQLANLAKQSGNQNVSNTTLVMKRCYDRDIVFNGDYIHDIWLQKLEKQNEREDIIIAGCDGNIRFLNIRKDKVNTFRFEQEISGVAAIGMMLLVTTKNCETFGFQYYDNGEIREHGKALNQPVKLIKTYHKKVQGQQFAGGPTNDGKVTFINNTLKTFTVDLNQLQSDICFIQYGTIPCSLVLSPSGKLTCINLLTFETQILLQFAPKPTISFSSIQILQDHLLVGIDGFGIVIYHYEQLNKIVGAVALGEKKWSIESNTKGNLVVMALDDMGRGQTSIYKLRRL